MADATSEAPALSPRTPTKPRIGIIDRDSGFLQVLANRLSGRGWEHRALSTPVRVEALLPMRLNALVLDLAVAGPDAWDYLEAVCTRMPGLAVVVCTPPTSVADRVRGLRLGADAWLTKPCHPEELIAVAEAAIRRHRRQEVPGVAAGLDAGEITIRPDLYQAYVGERSLDLTPREFELLALLARSDRVMRREEIYERVWGYAMMHGDRSVDVFVRKLRQKLRAASPGWRYIHTHFGVGYRFIAVSELGGPEPDAPAAETTALEATEPEPALTR
ncbi:MAG TPA: response regulator transcription factor [Solirubrobacteraceae bacterium]|nr:response regulator transcription factor [Solirubrobacteraceae bacterium]